MNQEIAKSIQNDFKMPLTNIIIQNNDNKRFDSRHQILNVNGQDLQFTKIIQFNNQDSLPIKQSQTIIHQIENGLTKNINYAKKSLVVKKQSSSINLCEFQKEQQLQQKKKLNLEANQYKSNNLIQRQMQIKQLQKQIQQDRIQYLKQQQISQINIEQLKKTINLVSYKLSIAEKKNQISIKNLESLISTKNKYQNEQQEQKQYINQLQVKIDAKKKVLEQIQKSFNILKNQIQKQILDPNSEQISDLKKIQYLKQHIQKISFQNDNSELFLINQQKIKTIKNQIIKIKQDIQIKNHEATQQINQQLVYLNTQKNVKQMLLEKEEHKLSFLNATFKLQQLNYQLEKSQSEYKILLKDEEFIMNTIKQNQEKRIKKVQNIARIKEKFSNFNIQKSLRLDEKLQKCKNQNNQLLEKFQSITTCNKEFKDQNQRLNQQYKSLKNQIDFINQLQNSKTYQELQELTNKNNALSNLNKKYVHVNQIKRCRQQINQQKQKVLKQSESIQLYKKNQMQFYEIQLIRLKIEYQSQLNKQNQQIKQLNLISDQKKQILQNAVKDKQQILMQIKKLKEKTKQYIKIINHNKIIKQQLKQKKREIYFKEKQPKPKKNNKSTKNKGSKNKKSQNLSDSESDANALSDTEQVSTTSNMQLNIISKLFKNQKIKKNTIRLAFIIIVFIIAYEYHS